jgi:hypothetical protein
MKKLFAVCGLALLMTIPASAQFSWGIRAGVNAVNNDITAIDKEAVVSKDSYTGFFAGPMMEFQIPIISAGVDAAILYSQKGMEIAEKETIKEQAIAIPVSLKYTLGLGNFLGAFVQAGPQLNYNLGELTTLYQEDIKGDNLQSGFADVKEFAMNRMVWSMNLGVGVKLFNHLQAAVNYNIPLTPSGAYTLYENVETGANDNASILDRIEAAGKAKDTADEAYKSRVLQFSVTYTF